MQQALHQCIVAIKYLVRTKYRSTLAVHVWISWIVRMDGEIAARPQYSNMYHQTPDTKPPDTHAIYCYYKVASISLDYQLQPTLGSRPWKAPRELRCGPGSQHYSINYYSGVELNSSRISVLYPIIPCAESGRLYAHSSRGVVIVYFCAAQYCCTTSTLPVVCGMWYDV